MKMEENEARLFYKNKITKAFYLLSYIFLGIFGFLFIILSGIGLIVENGSPSVPYLYVTLGFGGLSLIVAIVVLCFAFIHNDDGFSYLRLNVVSGMKLFLRLFNTLGSFVMLMGSFLGKIGFDVGNEPWGNFLKVSAIVLLVIEGTMSLYSLWKFAWRKENPERYAPGLIKSALPSKRETERPKKKEKKEKDVKKEEKTSSSPLKDKENEVIDNPEIKQIEKK
ncbi:MAG TPA: hypothetical protein DD384_06095 [Firmicutes bacterium]|nr:hypothetical protein [Bacillota bacterium]